MFVLSVLGVALVIVAQSGGGGGGGELWGRGWGGVSCGEGAPSGGGGE